MEGIEEEFEGGVWLGTKLGAEADEDDSASAEGNVGHGDAVV